MPLGKDDPLRLSFVVSLFILLIKSRTDPLAMEEGGAPDDGFLAASALSPTLVTSPDFLSTPTMDQGLGLGNGLGLGGAVSGDVDSSLIILPVFVVIVDLGLASGEGEDFFSKFENFEERKPSMEPPAPPLRSLLSFLSISLSSPLFDLSLVAVANSLVGEVRLAAKPVDLLVVRKKSNKSTHTGNN